MDIYSPDELVATVVDQAHQLRRSGSEIARLARENARLQAALVAAQAAPTGDHDHEEDDGA